MVYLLYGKKITVRKFRKDWLDVKNFREMEWFRPPGYDDQTTSYGLFEGVYELNRTLNLLDLGNWQIRNQIIAETSLTPYDMTPDNQYCGGAENEKIHRAILNSLKFKHYDGTIIEETRLTDPKEDLEGLNEIVLFRDRVFNAISLIKKPLNPL